jgi:hypothetical protein
MEATKKKVGFSERHQEESKRIEAALAKVGPFLIQEAREKGTMIVVADKDGNPKYVTADQFEKGDY